MLQTMAVSEEDNQFDWWKTKVCPLSIHTNGQQPSNNLVQNTYIVNIFL